MYYNQLKIVGCGGHSKVVIDALSLLDCNFKLSLCDDDINKIGKEFLGIIVDSKADSLRTFFGFIHVAIGNNLIRRRIINQDLVNFELVTIIHPSSLISKSAKIGIGSFIAAKALLGPDSFVGTGCIINHGAIIDHDVSIGSYSHIAPNCTLGGNVTIGECVLVGAGAVVLPGITIGDGVIIGAGAVVTKNVAKDKVVKGIPAM